MFPPEIPAPTDAAKHFGAKDWRGPTRNSPALSIQLLFLFPILTAGIIPAAVHERDSCCGTVHDAAVDRIQPPKISIE